MRDFGVNLRCADILMTQHFRKGFDRYAVGKAYFRRVCVAAHVEYTRQSKQQRTGID